MDRYLDEQFRLADCDWRCLGVRASSLSARRTARTRSQNGRRLNSRVKQPDLPLIAHSVSRHDMQEGIVDYLSSIEHKSRFLLVLLQLLSYSGFQIFHSWALDTTDSRRPTRCQLIIRKELALFLVLSSICLAVLGVNFAQAGLFVFVNLFQYYCWNTQKSSLVELKR